MSYFCTQIFLKTNGEFGRSTSQFATLDAAEIAFHDAMSAIMRKEENVKAIVIVIDENGVIKFKRAWAREQ